MTIEYNNIGLRKLQKLLKDDQPMANVGILGQNDTRSSGGLTFEQVKALTKKFNPEENSNASIGMKHEFGNDGLPIRSFLRQPIIEQMQRYLDKTGPISEDLIKEMIRTGSMAPYIKKLGVLAETIIADAFDTGGFGKWKPSNMKYKHNQQTLVETQQLRNSITSEVPT